MQFILEEDRDGGYQARTEINAREADVTIAIAVNFNSPGEKLTKQFVKKYNRLYIPVSPYGDITEKAVKIVALINETFENKNVPITLNIAGNGIATLNGSLTQEQCDDFTYNLLFLIKNNVNLKPKIKMIRSGGQTGFDEAGIKAGLKLKIDTVAYFPKGYRIKDLDGDKTQTRAEVFKRMGYKQKTKVFVDMDGVLCDFYGAYMKWKSEHPEITFPQSQFGFFSNLEPIPGAIEGYNKLKENFDVYILTRPSIYNLMCYTEKADWIKRYLGFHVLENMILSCDKSLIIGKGNYLIDDDIHANQLDFEGTLLKFGGTEFPDWNAIIKHLIKEEHYEKTLN